MKKSTKVFKGLKRSCKLNQKCDSRILNFHNNLCLLKSEKYEKTNQDAKVNLVHKELSSFIENIVHDVR